MLLEIDSQIAEEGLVWTCLIQTGTYISSTRIDGLLPVVLIIMHSLSVSSNLSSLPTVYLMNGLILPPCCWISLMNTDIYRGVMHWLLTWSMCFGWESNSLVGLALDSFVSD